MQVNSLDPLILLVDDDRCRLWRERSKAVAGLLSVPGTEMSEGPGLTSRHTESFQLQENLPLARYTTLGIGGPARFFVEATDEGQILDSLNLARARNWPVLVMGGGSNLLVSDSGFPGLVLRIALKGVRFDEKGSGNVEAAAGEEWDSFVASCVSRNLAGLECLSGIPGTVGGTPIQNVGAYGQEVGETIDLIRVLDRKDHSIQHLKGSQCGFAYRSSIFNNEQRDRYIVLRVSFSLNADGPPCLRYADLQKRFSETPFQPSIAEVRRAILEIRAGKAMLLQPGDPDSKSAGSFFKNPILSIEALRRAEQSARASGRLAVGEELPRYGILPDLFKVPAAWLIERAGFVRGCKRGRVGLSSKHALALINRGGASAREVLDFMNEIQTGVRVAFGIDLIPEPVLVGF
jgi:UDP-N-acetylmuramate dehydrogenase